MDIDQDREIERSEIFLDDLSLTERVVILQKSGVTTVICGGISDLLQNMLQGVNISLIAGIAGDAEQVVTAYLSRRLDAPKFHMPGYAEG